MTEREQLAWAAGFFDGEGTVGDSVRRTPTGTTYRAIGAQVAQSDPERLDHFAAILGFGHVRGPYRPKNHRARPYSVLGFDNFETVQALAAMLWPWLGPTKRRQFARALRSFRAFVPEVALCEHGAPRQKCQPCRSRWTTEGWAKRKANA